MQHSYANIRLIYVNMQHKYVDMQHDCVNMRDNTQVPRYLLFCEEGIFLVPMHSHWWVQKIPPI